MKSRTVVCILWMIGHRKAKPSIFPRNRTKRSLWKRRKGRRQLTSGKPWNNACHGCRGESPSLVSIYIALNLGLFPKVGGKVHGFVDTGNNDDQCGHSAHHDGIYERFQKGDHTLFGRVRNLGRGMSNGCRANACLVGKNSPLDANNEYSQKSSESGFEAESTFENQGYGGRDCINVQGENRKAGEQVDSHMAGTMREATLAIPLMPPRMTSPTRVVSAKP